VSANFGANYTVYIAPQWRLALEVSTTWANSLYMQAYFGVSAAQSLLSRPCQTPFSFPHMAVADPSREANQGLRPVVLHRCQELRKTPP